MDNSSPFKNSGGNGETHDETASYSADREKPDGANAEDWAGFWETIGVFVFGGIGVAFTEAGLHLGAFLFDFLAVSCGVGLGCHQLKRLRKLESVSVPFMSCVCIIFLVFAGLYLYVRHIDEPEPARSPRFVFGLVIDNDFEHPLLLTNDFLQIPEFNRPLTNSITGYILFPIRQNSHFEMKMLVRNAGNASMEEAHVTISLPKELQATLDPGWTPTSDGDVTEDPIRNIDWQMRSWSVKISDVLPGDGTGLPDVGSENIPWGFPNQSRDRGIFPICVKGRAKDSPAQGVNFAALFLLVSTNSDPVKPFIIQGTNIGEDVVFVVPPEKLKGLKPPSL